MTYALRTAAGIVSGLAPTTDAALEPLNDAARRAFRGVIAPGTSWRATGHPPGHNLPAWVREDVPLSYLARDGSGAFTAFAADDAQLRDTAGGFNVALATAPATTPRAPRVLPVATLASAYVGQTAVAFHPSSGRWLAGTVVADATSVLMPAGSATRPALPASTPAALVSDARDDLINAARAGTSLRVFRTAADGGLVLGYVTRNEPEVLPTEPTVALAALTTLGALAGTPRDGRRVVVNIGDGSRPAWVPVRWT